jgi:signal transduction histidine kinase
VDHILRAGWYLLDLVGEILDLTSIESGKLTLALGPVSVQELLQESCASAEAAASERHIVVRVAPLPRPFVVDCDHARIKQIMGHLLSNAIQFNRAGGSVEVDCSQISSTRLRIAVRDTGEGLNKEKIAQLFQPFNRLGHENNAQEGTGVGLALSKRLVEMMGGAIGVQSTVGVGSVFWIEANLFQDPSPSATNAISADDAT